MSLLGTPAARGAVLVVAWSSGFIGAELGARHAAPDTVLAWRCLATAVLLLPWAVRAAARLDRRAWAEQAVLALLCQALYLGGVFWAAAAGVPAGTSALITSLQPAVVLAAAAVGTGRGPRPAHLLGLGLGTAGVALTALGDLRSGVTLTALLLPLGAMLSLTGGTLLQERWSARRTTPLLDALAVQSLVTAGLTTAYAASSGSLAAPPTTGFLVAVAWAVLAGFGSYGCYYLVTARDGATRASALLYLTPAATALWSAPMLGQPIRVATALGLVITASAVVLLRDGGRPPAAEGTADWSPTADVSAHTMPLVTKRQTQTPQPKDRHADTSSPQSSASRRTCGA